MMAAWQWGESQVMDAVLLGLGRQQQSHLRHVLLLLPPQQVLLLQASSRCTWPCRRLHPPPQPTAVSSLAGSRQLGAAPDQVDRPTVVKMAAIRDPGVGPVATAVAAAAALQADKEQAHQKTATAEATTAPGAEWQDPSAGAPSGRPGCMPA